MTKPFERNFLVHVFVAMDLGLSSGRRGTQWAPTTVANPGGLQNQMSFAVFWSNDCIWFVSVALLALSLEGSAFPKRRPWLWGLHSRNDRTSRSLMIDMMLPFELPARTSHGMWERKPSMRPWRQPWGALHLSTWLRSFNSETYCQLWRRSSQWLSLDRPVGATSDWWSFENGVPKGLQLTSRSLGQRWAAMVVSYPSDLLVCSRSWPQDLEVGRRKRIGDTWMAVEMKSHGFNLVRNCWLLARVRGLHLPEWATSWCSHWTASTSLLDTNADMAPMSSCLKPRGGWRAPWKAWSLRLTEQILSLPHTEEVCSAFQMCYAETLTGRARGISLGWHAGVCSVGTKKAEAKNPRSGLTQEEFDAMLAVMDGSPAEIEETRQQEMSPDFGGGPQDPEGSKDPQGPEDPEEECLDLVAATNALVAPGMVAVAMGVVLESSQLRGPEAMAMAVGSSQLTDPETIAASFLMEYKTRMTKPIERECLVDVFVAVDWGLSSERRGAQWAPTTVANPRGPQNQMSFAVFWSNDCIWFVSVALLALSLEGSAFPKRRPWLWGLHSRNDRASRSLMIDMMLPLELPGRQPRGALRLSAWLSLDRPVGATSDWWCFENGVPKGLQQAGGWGSVGAAMVVSYPSDLLVCSRSWPQDLEVGRCKRIGDTWMAVEMKSHGFNLVRNCWLLARVGWASPSRVGNAVVLTLKPPQPESPGYKHGHGTYVFLSEAGGGSRSLCLAEQVLSPAAFCRSPEEVLQMCYLEWKSDRNLSRLACSSSSASMLQSLARRRVLRRHQEGWGEESRDGGDLPTRDVTRLWRRSTRSRGIKRSTRPRRSRRKILGFGGRD